MYCPGQVPEGAIVLVSGLCSAAEAQCQVSTGVGTLVGSTIMLLTIPWAFSLFIGCRYLDPNTGFQVMRSYVTTYSNTVAGAKIMIVSSISYMIVLVPAMIEKNAPRRSRLPTSFITCSVRLHHLRVRLLCHSVFQVVDSRASTTQELEQTRLKFVEWQ